MEAACQAVVRHMKREGQLRIRIFPDKPITKKPAEVRMGKGKGSPEGIRGPDNTRTNHSRPEGVPYEVAKEALRLGAQKLPIITKFVIRRDYEID
ncbi:MAG: ribosomal protein L16 [Bacteroidales bacterium]